MRNKRLIIICFILCILFTLTGCQLAREDAGEASYIDKDRLIGVLVTREYLDLFDMEGYLNDNIDKLTRGGEISLEGNNSEYQGRLYATLKTQVLTEEETGNTMNTKEFVFDSVDGIAFFAATVPATESEDSFITSGSDEGISDGHSAYNYGDEEDSTTLEGTIYFSPSSTDTIFYINPVFQSADGSVYATTGNGYKVDGMLGEGPSYSTTLSETTTITENGKSKASSISITISLTMMYTPEKVVLLQMDQNSTIVSRKEYSPGELPESISTESDTAYLIVENYKRDYEGNSVISRSIYDSNQETLETFYSRDDGVCVKEWTQINWEKSGFSNH